MRLTKIKLAGFKSFVDPTQISFPSNLTGVIGPNGCGKSNVIDAVRWVMGELSAKHLRGDNMADVVFNGSAARKPVGTASVELLFDNADGKIGGAYANYSEISLKRHVARDDTSAYFINGVRCRRKDITNLFLGTGLGSRSYAIIEQGMISRVIEARSEDMRAFVEEAAGVSRYKERRKETEARVAETRENLERLQDVRDEVEKQIRHLQRQAASARRYQALKEQERRLTAELRAEIARLTPACEAAQQAEQRAGAALEASEQALQDWQQRWETHAQAVSAADQTTQVERARIEQLENQLRQLGAQAERLAGEQHTLSAQDGAEQLARLGLQEEQARRAAEQLSGELGEEVSGALTALATGRVTLVESGSAAPSRLEATLAAHVTGPAAVSARLGAVLTAESLADALRARAALAEGRSFITREGEWV